MEKVLLSLQPHGESSRRLGTGPYPLFRHDQRLYRPMDLQDTACGHPTCYFSRSVRCVISMSWFFALKPAFLRRGESRRRATHMCPPSYCCSPPPLKVSVQTVCFTNVHSPARSEVENEMLHKHTTHIFPRHIIECCCENCVSFLIPFHSWDVSKNVHSPALGEVVSEMLHKAHITHFSQRHIVKLC